MTYMSAQTTSSTCCQRGDWDGATHQPASAYLYVPVVMRKVFRNERTVTILPETTDDYRWECIYCGRVGTAVQLKS